MAEETFADPLAAQYYHQSVTELETSQSADAVLLKAAACELKEDRESGARLPQRGPATASLAAIHPGRAGVLQCRQTV
jgi:hypothetical protein